jgi:superfamily II DNA or RNA helicase
MRAALAAARSSAPPWWPVTAARQPIALLPWQFVPAVMMLSGHHRRVLLADEVGMGKTVQAAILLHEIHAREPGATTLVVVPAGLVAQWASELRQRSRLEVSVLTADALRAEAIQPRRIVDAARPGTCWLISIDLLRQPDVIALVARTRWTLLVVDEAHVCAPGTARLEAVSRVAAASVRVLLLTASPTAAGEAGAGRLRAIGERPGEVAMPVLRRDGSRLARPRRRTCVLRVAFGEAHLDLCARLDRFADRARRESGAAGLLPALVLRRRASSSAAALVRSLERRLEVLGLAPPPVLDPPGLFDALTQDEQDDEVMGVAAWRNEGEERKEIGHLLTMARNLPAGGGKLHAVARLVRRCQQPVVVFTSFLDTLRALVPLLSRHHLVIVHGSQPDALRVDALETFTRGDADVLLTTDASAEGLNLHPRCRLVVHAEVPPSARLLEQRNGRIDRYGQSRRVHAVLMASATEDDTAALARLQARAAGDDSWLASAVPARCRRTEVARRIFAAWSPQTGVEGAGESSDRGDVAICALRPRRWRCLAAALCIPAGAQSISVTTLVASGGAELSASRVTACLVSPKPWRPSPGGASCWPTSLRGVEARARRLATRMDAWQQPATAAAAREAADEQPDLFGVRPLSAGTPGAKTIPATVWLTMEPRAVASVSAGAPYARAAKRTGTALADNDASR